MKKCSLKVSPEISREEAKQWVINLMQTWKLNYHPDDRAEDYVESVPKFDKRTFTDEEAKQLDESNKILRRKFGDDLYGFCIEAQQLVKERLKKQK